MPAEVFGVFHGTGYGFSGASSLGVFVAE